MEKEKVLQELAHCLDDRGELVGVFGIVIHEHEEKVTATIFIQGLENESVRTQEVASTLLFGTSTALKQLAFIDPPMTLQEKDK